jgi:phosphoribosyl 1,2-cyclic phosphodiesterase
VKVTVWGSRGSVASPGPETVGYGGNTSCVEVRNGHGDVVVLDGGTGARRLGRALLPRSEPLHIVLSHLHMDHIQGLGFFAPLFVPDLEVHLWGPPSTGQSHRARLGRYLNPPLFPVRLDELPCDLRVHDLPDDEFELPGFRVHAARVLHRGFTYGLRLEADGTAVTYMPDHEPALLETLFGSRPHWTSGYDLASRTDLLIHDAQYTDGDYLDRRGWGHTGTRDLVTFVGMVEPRVLMPFHFEPAYDDDELDAIVTRLEAELAPGVGVVAGREGTTVDVDWVADAAADR